MRPPKPRGRDRRLEDNEEVRLIETAIVISIETCVRQTEPATLIWGKVKLDAETPYLDLPMTVVRRRRCWHATRICVPIALALVCREGRSTDAEGARETPLWHDLALRVRNWRNAGE